MPSSISAKFPPQQASTKSRLKAMAATSCRYISQQSELQADGSLFHRFSGMHIVLKKGHVNGLFDAFHVGRDKTIDAKASHGVTSAILFVCDTLEIDGELCLPECDVM